MEEWELPPDSSIPMESQAGPDVNGSVDRSDEVERGYQLEEAWNEMQLDEEDDSCAGLERTMLKTPCQTGLRRRRVRWVTQLRACEH